MQSTPPLLRTALLALALVAGCVGPGTAATLDTEATTSEAALFEAPATEGAPSPAVELAGSDAEKERLLERLIDELAEGGRVSLPADQSWQATDRQARRLRTLARDRSRLERARAAASLLLQTRTDRASRAVALDVLADTAVGVDCGGPLLADTDGQTGHRIACADLLQTAP